MLLEPHRFHAKDLVGGDLALDFINTVTARDTTPRDWLATYSTLLEWGHLARALSGAEGKVLARRAAARPREAQAALTTAKAQRELLARLFQAHVAHRRPTRADLETLHRVRQAVTRAARVSWHLGRLRIDWAIDGSGLDLVTHRVFSQAEPLLDEAPGERLRVCSGHDCGWLFIDRSKAGRRRWCDMQTCGNVTKARRFRAHHGGAQP
jgi:predicted RNA-binding Zn ribbon-like protein